MAACCRFWPPALTAGAGASVAARFRLTRPSSAETLQVKGAGCAFAAASSSPSSPIAPSMVFACGGRLPPTALSLVKSSSAIPKNSALPVAKMFTKSHARCQTSSRCAAAFPMRPRNFCISGKFFFALTARRPIFIALRALNWAWVDASRLPDIQRLVRV